MVSEKQLVRDRQAWARGLVIVAWLKLSKAAEGSYLTLEELEEFEAGLRHAMAVAGEWGLNPRTIVEEAEQVRAEAAG
jgi:hypothetical protein